MDSTAVVMESQADWVRGSQHSPEAAERLATVARAWQAIERESGAKLRPFRLMGYQGLAVGRVRWGVRDGATLVELSGDLADIHLASVRELTDTVTRVDLAVTVQLGELDDDAGQRHYEEALTWYASRPNAALPKLVTDGDHGCTCYIGHRESPYMLRVYNKQRESEAAHDDEAAERYVRCWRYELETKGYAAPEIARLADDHPDRPEWIQSFLYLYAVEHGLLPLFPPSSQQALKPGFTRRSDRNKKLAWLAKTVAPTIQFCLASGDPADVRKALGLAS